MHDNDMPGDEPDPYEQFKKDLEPRGPLDRLMYRLYLRQKRNEQVGVTEPERLRHLWRYDTAIFLLLLVMLVVGMLVPGRTLLEEVASVTVGGIVGLNLFRTLSRARAYQRGWLDGRKLMVASMTEAMRRDMVIEDWLQCELERDFHVLRNL